MLVNKTLVIERLAGSRPNQQSSYQSLVPIGSLSIRNSFIHVVASIEVVAAKKSRELHSISPLR